MKNISIVFILLAASVTAFPQHKKWVEKINQLVEPEGYFLLKADYPNGYYKEFANKNGQKVIAVVTDTSKSQEGIVYNKIYVFSIYGDQLKMIDSSSKYEVDGRGPTVYMNSDSLICTHTFHRGYDKLIYTYQPEQDKFVLSAIEKQVGERSETAVNNYWCFRFQIDIKTGILVFESTDKYDTNYGPIGWSKKRVFTKPAPAFLHRLAGMKYPTYDECEYYDEIQKMWEDLYSYFEF